MKTIETLRNKTAFDKADIFEQEVEQIRQIIIMIKRKLN